MGMGTEKLKWLFCCVRESATEAEAEAKRAHACGCVLAQSSSQHLPNEHICMRGIICMCEKEREQAKFAQEFYARVN